MMTVAGKLDWLPRGMGIPPLDGIPITHRMSCVCAARRLIFGADDNHGLWFGQRLVPQRTAMSLLEERL